MFKDWYDFFRGRKLTSKSVWFATAPSFNEAHCSKQHFPLIDSVSSIFFVVSVSQSRDCTLINTSHTHRTRALICVDVIFGL